MNKKKNAAMKKHVEIEDDDGILSLRAPGLVKRVREVAREDRRSVSQILRMCVEEQLPALEKKLGLIKSKKT